MSYQTTWGLSLIELLGQRGSLVGLYHTTENTLCYTVEAWDKDPFQASQPISQEMGQSVNCTVLAGSVFPRTFMALRGDP